MTNTDTKPGFIRHLHGFRGFAILTIVAAHSWSLLLTLGAYAALPQFNLVYCITETLFHGSTIYFAIISGLLFSIVLRDKGWATFFRSKLVNVVSPYAFISLVFLALFWPFFVQWFESQGMSTNFLIAYFRGLLTGSIQLQFWYIPVLLVLYVLTPLFDYLIRDRRLIGIAVLIALAPLVISRSTYPELLSAQTVVYFAGAYVLGMLAGTRYEEVRTWIARNVIPLWLTSVATSLLIFWLFTNEYEPAGFYSRTQTLFYLQKLSIAALALHYLAATEARLPAWLLMFGSFAFAVYFLHFMVVFILGQVIIGVVGGNDSLVVAAAVGLVMLVAGAGVTLLLSWLLQKLFRRYSRMFIGA